MSGFPEHSVLGKPAMFLPWQWPRASATYGMVKVVVLAAVVIMGYICN